MSRQPDQVQVHIQIQIQSLDGSLRISSQRETPRLNVPKPSARHTLRPEVALKSPTADAPSSQLLSIPKRSIRTSTSSLPAPPPPPPPTPPAVEQLSQARSRSSQDSAANPVLYGYQDGIQRRTYVSAKPTIAELQPESPDQEPPQHRADKFVHNITTSQPPPIASDPRKLSKVREKFANIFYRKSRKKKSNQEVSVGLRGSRD